MNPAEMAEPDLAPIAAYLSQSGVASALYTDYEDRTNYQQQSPPALRVQTAGSDTVDAETFNSLTPTDDQLLNWEAYNLDNVDTVKIPGQLLEQQDSSFFQAMANSNLVPEFSRMGSDMRSQELFDNGNGAMNGHYDQQQSGYYEPPSYWSSVPVSTPSFPPTPRCRQSYSEVETTPDNDNGSLSLESDLVENEVEEHDASRVGDQDTNLTANDPTDRSVRSRLSPGVETMHSGLGRKPRTKKASKINQIESQAPTLKSSGLYFGSLTEARQVVQGLKWPAHPDETLPKTEEERESIVRELFNAIQDMSDVRDKESGPMFRKRWLGGATKDENANSDDVQETQKVASNAVYKPWEKERICWMIVDTAERIYREGTSFVSIIDPVKLQDCENSRHLTFRERITMLVRVLKMYKARIDKLMRGGVVEEYVLCPETLFRISGGNRESNDIRKEYIVAGRELKGKPVKRVVRQDGVAAPVSGGSRKRTSSDSEGAVTPPEPRTKRSRKG